MASETYPWDNFRQACDIDQSLCFLLTPFSRDFAGPKQVIEDVSREFHLRCERADDIQRPGIIHADIWSYIQKAAVIVADLTTFNPNVMLELGVATAVKEQFRVILIIKRDAATSVPFDLRPFRHIQYEDSLTGATDFRQRLREYFRLALSENATIATLTSRMIEWEKSDRNYSLLVQAETLARLRGGAKTYEMDDGLLAFFLAASIQHGIDLTWWTQLNIKNVHAVEVAVEMFVGPWIRPQFRAAFFLQSCELELRIKALAEARLHAVSPLIKQLLDAVEQHKVVEFTFTEGQSLITESERYELVHNFVPHTKIKLSK